MVVLPTPPFGAKTSMTAGSRRRPAVRELLVDAGDPGHQVVAGERHRQDAVDAARGPTSTGFWGTVSTMTGTPSSGLVDLLDELQALDPALEQGVDHDDVGPQLADLATALLPSVTTSSSLTCAWVLSRPRMY